MFCQTESVISDFRRNCEADELANKVESRKRNCEADELANKE